MKYIILLAGQAVYGATTLPKVVASNYPYRPDMSHIMYDQDVVWTTSLTEYAGFQMQTWAFCHSAPWVSATSVSAMNICEAERAGHLNPVHEVTGTGAMAYCSGSFRQDNVAGDTWFDGSNDVQVGTAGFKPDEYDGEAITIAGDVTNQLKELGWCLQDDTDYDTANFGDDRCTNPSCWVNNCDYDARDCMNTKAGAATGQGSDRTGRWGFIKTSASAAKTQTFYGVQNMCSWDHNFQKAAFDTTANMEYKVHLEINDLARISETYFYEWQYVDESAAPYSGSATQLYKRPNIQQMSAASKGGGRRVQHKDAYTTLLDTTGKKLAYKLEARVASKQTGFFAQCKDNDTISAFTVSRGTDGKFDYTTPVKIGTYFDGKKKQTVQSTKFYWDSETAGQTTFLMREQNTQSDYQSSHGYFGEGTMQDATLNFACVRSDQLQYTTCSKLRKDVRDTCKTDQQPTTGGGTDFECRCGGMKTLMDGAHTLWTATCAADAAGKWDGYNKCTVTGGTSLSTLCAAGDALVNIDSRSGGDLGSAVVGVFNVNPLDITSTEFLHLVRENDIAFPNPTFNHPSTNIDEMTLLIGCSQGGSTVGGTLTEPAKWWTVRNDNYARFDADTTAGANQGDLTAADRFNGDASYTMFNSVHNELNTFHNDCKKGNYLVGSVDGLKWTKIARIGAAAGPLYNQEL